VHRCVGAVLTPAGSPPPLSGHCPHQRRRAVVADSGINLFLASLVLRSKDPENPPLKALLLSMLGGLVLGLVGWLGGELVQRMGVGVTPGASLDAPNSLISPDR